MAGVYELRTGVVGGAGGGAKTNLIQPFGRFSAGGGAGSVQRYAADMHGEKKKKTRMHAATSARTVDTGHTVHSDVNSGKTPSATWRICLQRVTVSRHRAHTRRQAGQGCLLHLASPLSSVFSSHKYFSVCSQTLFLLPGIFAS